MFKHLTMSLVLVGGAASAVEGAKPGETTEGLAMQAARGKMMSARGAKVAYTKKFDLSALPKYQPARKVSGTIRIWGTNYITDGPLASYWEAAFKKHHPEVKFDYHTKTTLSAVPSLIFGVSDVGMGRKITFGEQEMFERYTDRSPIEISIATGSYDVPGWNPGFGVVVNIDNPITQLTMDQLDGIFGSERAGGWEGTSWRPQRARGPEKNIRKWGQLGLTGEWADKDIAPYGLTLRYHQATTISDMVLKSSDKWNEKLKIYANFVSAAGKLDRGMNEDLANDRYGIGIVAAPTTNLTGGAAQPKQKVLAIAKSPGGPFVPYTLDTVHDRTYPMFDEIFAYIDRDPAKPLDPKVLEYLRFIVSQEGQAEVMRDGKYLPLTAEVANAQMKKLDQVSK